MKYTAVILAGGRSTRMGFDKQMLSINQIQLYQRNICALSKEFDSIAVITRTPQLYKSLNVLTFSDLIPDLGPLSGIHTALKKCDCDYVYVMACDMPHISLPYIKHQKSILEAHKPDALITLNGEWIEPFHAFYSKNCLPTIEDDLLRGKASIYKFLQKVNTYYIKENSARAFSPDFSMFMNLNTKEEYELFLKSEG